jgi:Protein of unknown function (DUF5663)
MDPKLKAQILNEFGLGALPQAEQDAALEKVGGMIFQGVFMRCAEALPEDKQKELSAMITGSGASAPTDPQALFTFLSTNVPDFENIMKSEVTRFKEESARIMGGIK